MSSFAGLAQNGTATIERKCLFQSTTINEIINVEPSIIWSILTDASDYPRWNSTIVSIEGEIQKEKNKAKKYP
ncbi:MAG: hypothetical protein R2784_21015 [Saprospiraceae bacterium]